MYFLDGFDLFEHTLCNPGNNAFSFPKIPKFLHQPTVGLPQVVCHHDLSLIRIDGVLNKVKRQSQSLHEVRIVPQGLNNGSIGHVKEAAHPFHSILDLIDMVDCDKLYNFHHSIIIVVPLLKRGKAKLRINYLL